MTIENQYTLRKKTFSIFRTTTFNPGSTYARKNLYFPGNRYGLTVCRLTEMLMQSS